MPDTQDRPYPEVGQVWADNDPRGEARRFTITEVDEEAGVVRTAPVGGGKATRIAINRLLKSGHRGYTYVGKTK